MKKEILKRLRQIEKDNDVRILSAIESGSRMWGFSSKNSDYDIRFIYINNPHYYLSVNKKKDYIEVMDKEKNLDFSGWDIKKALSLLIRSNMSLYEWINSPITYVNSDEMDSLINLSEYLWEKKNLIYAHIHLARGNYQHYIANKTEIKLKKYLYILRTIAACMWLEKNHIGRDLPNIENGIYTLDCKEEIISRYCSYPVTIDHLSLVIKEDNKYIYDLLQKIVKAKKEGKELSTSKPNKRANKWIEKKIEYYKNYAYNLGNTSKSKREISIIMLDNFLYSTVLEEIEKRKQNLPTTLEIEIKNLEAKL